MLIMLLYLIDRRTKPARTLQRYIIYPEKLHPTQDFN